MRRSHRSVLFGLALLVLLSGCTTMLKERQVTKTRADEEGTPFDVAVEQESVQHLSYRLFLPVIGHAFFWFPPLSLGNEWELRRKEALVYRRDDAGTGVREDREIVIQAENSAILAIVGERMKREQELIFRYVMGLVDTARRSAVRQVDSAVVYPESALRWCERVDAAALGSGALDRHSQRLLAAGRDAELVERLLQAPYTVEAADLPSYSFSVTVTYTEVNVETGKEEIKLERKTYTVTSPPMPIGELVHPLSEFNVQVVRHFSDLKSGKGLGGVKETYLLQPASDESKPFKKVLFGAAAF